jgi:predicted amidohydrolase YtcJ
MSDEDRDPGEDRPTQSSGVSRRTFVAGGAGGAALGFGGALGFVPPRRADAAGRNAAHRATAPTDFGGDLLLVNGKIHTLDARNRVVSSALIRAGRFAALGHNLRRPSGARVIDLKGRQVLPGLVDTHNHFVLMGLRPGYHTPLENEYSIADVQETISARRAVVPAGQWITTIGGFNPSQFAERRLPTRAELDDAVSDRPVFIQVSFAGPSTTNSRGREFFISKGIVVGEDGAIAGGTGLGGTSPTQQALYELRLLQTFEDKQRTTLDTMSYATRVGVTTHLDQGAWPSAASCGAGCGCAGDVPPSCGQAPTDSAAHADEYGMHLPLVGLHREGRMTVRVRINFLLFEDDPTLPHLKARLANSWQFFGSDYLRTGGIGEFTSGGAIVTPNPTWVEATTLVARSGWRNENHSIVPPDDEVVISGWEAVNEVAPITELRWVLAHVPFITDARLRRLKALGAGVNLSGFRYFGADSGPPYRTILASGIRAAAGGDGMQIAPMNPFIHIYHATTGLNARGELINPGQQISRLAALRLWTSATPWFFDDEPLGTIEVGNYGDLIVLNKDYFKVPDEELKRLRSILTVVGGRVVHDARVL